MKSTSQNHLLLLWWELSLRLWKKMLTDVSATPPIEWAICRSSWNKSKIRIVHIFFFLQLVHTDTVNNKLCRATVLGQLRKRCSIHGASRLCHSWCALPNLLNWRSLFFVFVPRKYRAVSFIWCISFYFLFTCIDEVNSEFFSRHSYWSFFSYSLAY